jgi:BlaR1 peptidase M56
MLGLVLLATYALAALLCAGVVALLWHCGVKRARAACVDLLALRLLPAAGALLLVLCIALPAFLRHEPHQERETVGPLLLALAALALLSLGHGMYRGWRAWSAARSLVRTCGSAARCMTEGGQRVQVLDLDRPLIAVVGGWRPRVVAAECVLSACSPEEFRQVVAHEAAHLSARDNLKLLLLEVCPDPLAWTSLGRALTERWRTEAEYAADQRATLDDPHKRVELASALIKVARLFQTARAAPHALAMSVAVEDVQGRVRQLLRPAQLPAPRLTIAWSGLALLLPVAALPLHGLVHRLLEALVRFGL